MEHKFAWYQYFDNVFCVLLIILQLLEVAIIVQSFVIPTLVQKKSIIFILTVQNLLFLDILHKTIQRQQSAYNMYFIYYHACLRPI